MGAGGRRLGCRRNFGAPDPGHTHPEGLPTSSNPSCLLPDGGTAGGSAHCICPQVPPPQLSWAMVPSYWALLSQSSGQGLCAELPSHTSAQEQPGHVTTRGETTGGEHCLDPAPQSPSYAPTSCPKPLPALKLPLRACAPSCTPNPCGRSSV